MAVTDCSRLFPVMVKGLACAMAFVQIATAATLPQDNVDVLYHRYDGGGMVIDGPSVLVRKSVGPQVSVSGQYYVDMVSAASVDVVALASEYTEERTEYTLSLIHI